MDISAGIQASLAGRYASALFDLASENGTVTAVESDLDKVEAALAESSELAAVTTNPKVSRGEAQKALWGVSALLGVSELTQNFLGVLAQNRRLGELPQVIRAFRAIAAAQRGEVTAEVSKAICTHVTDSGSAQAVRKEDRMAHRSRLLTHKMLESNM